MTESKKLPKTPNDTPEDFWRSERQANILRNAFVSTLLEMQAVSIEYEQDEECDCDDEPHGTWEVAITNAHGKQFRAEHSELVNALWYVLEHATAADSKEWDARDAKRKKVLAKLSDDERELLGVTY